MVVGGWTCLPSIVPTRQSGSNTRNGVLKVYGKIKSLVSRGYSSGLIKIDDLSVDSSTVAAKKGGQQIGFDGHKKTKGSKIHVAVTPQCLPIAIDLGSGNEHESRKLIPLLNDIQITNNNGRTTQEQTRTCLG